MQLLGRLDFKDLAERNSYHVWKLEGVQMQCFASVQR